MSVPFYCLSPFIASLTYDNADKMTNISRTVSSALGSATITTALTWDNADRLTNIVLQSNGSILSSFTYTFDAANQLTSYTGPEGTLNYSYDPTGQLTGVSGARSESYSYSLNGNRTMTGYVTGTANRLLSDGAYNYTYDNEGNMLTKTRISDGQRTEFTWDYRNRLTKVVVKDSSGNVLAEQDNTYDVFDRRIGVFTNNGGTTSQLYTVYDGGNPYIDFNGSGSVTARYLEGLGIDQLFAKIDGSGNMRWYLTDILGSVRQIVSASGAVLDQLTYDTFGNILSESSAANGDRFKFRGREWDSIIGAYYSARGELDPMIGRYISPAPNGLRGGDANPYRYVYNSPTDLVDGVGELWSVWGVIGGFVEGAAIGFATGVLVGALVVAATAAAPAVAALATVAAGQAVLGAGLIGGSAAAAVGVVKGARADSFLGGASAAAGWEVYAAGALGGAGGSGLYLYHHGRVTVTVRSVFIRSGEIPYPRPPWPPMEGPFRPPQPPIR